VEALRPRVTPKGHLTFKVSDGKQTIDAFGPNLGVCADRLKREPRIDLVFEFGTSSFQGYETLEMRIRDMRWQ
jgi:hypothetical protein